MDIFIGNTLGSYTTFDHNIIFILINYCTNSICYTMTKRIRSRPSLVYNFLQLRMFELVLLACNIHSLRYNYSIYFRMSRG